MTSYINQTIARHHVAELIAQAEQGRVRRQFRQARRQARTDASESATRSGSGRSSRRDPYLQYLVPAVR
ncbi:rRNA processing protein Krr1/Pno1 [Marmoricola sp. URHA0025 HA25]